MIETRVRIVAARPGLAWVEPSEPSGCAACKVGSRCALSGLGRFFSARRAPIAIACDAARAGEERTLAVRESDLLRAAFAAYLFPIVLAIAVAAFAERAALGDIAAAAGAVAGLLSGLLIGRRLVRPPVLHPLPKRTTASGDTP